MQGPRGTVTGVSLREVFSSVQGEGPYVGCRHLFVRFAGCNLSCRYCDTPRDIPVSCKVQVQPGGHEVVKIPNPLTPEEVAVLAAGLDLSRHHAVSLTGGEPLLYPEFLQELIPLLRGARRGIYLETNGTLPAALEAVVELVDLVAMDVKLPSATGMAPFWEKHREFLRVAQGREVIVKAVVIRGTPLAEVITAAELAAAAGATLVLQPVTTNDRALRPSPAELLRLQAEALGIARDVRVIPQVHRFCGMW
ncbi:organic radical activating enzyme [Thermodesulfitimonas autotrophica]|uniref:7-carboxy-7-deazaguanine synthase n=1 Tax=Thermodesulfitimonas autotrophica TaxID=1894989 RepID=A0A3N5BUW5_9THEO|nr:7-carboxy-7-deazaguanine synthase QueE [Thermodesulfitimonas autotrophica]RPF49685.1 organic radical activating enzyme [Thermodesulfitimonas autotrophica]